MGFYKIRVGHQLGQSGRTFVEGEVLEIPDSIAHEGNIRDHVEPCDELGNVIRPITPLSEVEMELATVRQHERISILERELAKRRAAVTEIEDRMAHERARNAPPVPVSAESVEEPDQ